MPAQQHIENEEDNPASMSHTGNAKKVPQDVQPAAMAFPSQPIQALIDGMAHLQEELSSMKKDQARLAGLVTTPSHAKGKQPKHIATQKKHIMREDYSSEEAESSEEHEVSQAILNAKMIRILTEMHRDKKESLKETHWHKSWKQKVLPPIVCEKILESHNRDDQVYSQVAACNATKALQDIYALHHEDVDNDKITPDSPLYNVALHISKSIKAALAAHAFPH